MLHRVLLSCGYELAPRHLRKIAKLRELKGYFIDIISVLNGNMSTLTLLNLIKQIF